MRKALILGTGAAQVDAIHYLRNAGWWVIGCSYLRDGPGLSLVHEFRQINITDVPALEGLARSEGVELVYSVGSDLAMPAVARVATALGLRRFISPAQADLTQNKVSLRDHLRSHHISPVSYRQLRRRADATGWDHFPAIVKPADSQGQRGVGRADSMGELLACLKPALAASRCATAIVEELLDGPEVSANVFVVGGKIVVNELSDRLVVTDFPGGIPRGHVLPAQSGSETVLAEARELAERCVRALGIENGPVYLQMKLTRCGPRIIEITPRLDGCHIWRLILEARGIDLLAASFQLLAGEPLRALDGPRRADDLSLHFFLQTPGEPSSRAPHQPPRAALYNEFYLQEGDIVAAVNGHLEKVGYFLLREPACASR
ncbi:acetyl-CoA carboxylase biotin carboxylase subunit family protein [Accumulibacter sp.]|uniref:ATP-grasp domain-containing protein n=1 Tax=Accumulibacter sp. TaxID=2053492 RepID=UPI00159B0F46|nr:MAG: ATP-grasp domain-containing protein [Candidatus Accumulibacter similis]